MVVFCVASRYKINICKISKTEHLLKNIYYKYLLDETNFYLSSFIHKNMYKIARTFAVYW